MTNFLKKYGIWEYVLFLSGGIGLGKLTYNFATESLEYSALNGVVFVLSVLLIAAPATVVRAVKSRLQKESSTYPENPKKQ